MGNKKSTQIVPISKRPKSKRFSYEEYDEADRYISISKLVRPPNVYVGLTNYQTRAPQELSFKRGDLFEAITPVMGDKLLVRCLVGSKQGLIPSSFVAKQESLRAQDYYFGTISRREAEQLILSPNNCTGTFLVRDSERVPNSYVITIKDFDNVKGYHPKNYRIRCLGPEKYCIEPTQMFKSLPELISFYQKRVTHFHLVRACPRFVNNSSFGLNGQWHRSGNVAIRTLRVGSMSEGAFIEEALKMFRQNKLISLYAVCPTEALQ